MKKFLILAIGLIISSCSTEEFGTKNEELKTITTNYYVDNQLDSWEKGLFVKQQLVGYKSSDSSSIEYKYKSKNLVSEILDFDSDHVLILTRKFTFDNQERVTEIKYTTPNEVMVSTVVYAANSILVRQDNGNETTVATDLVVNNQGQIISRKVVSKRGTTTTTISTDYQYLNGNLTTATTLNANNTTSQSNLFL